MRFNAEIKSGLYRRFKRVLKKKKKTKAKWVRELMEKEINENGSGTTTEPPATAG